MFQPILPRKGMAWRFWQYRDMMRLLLRILRLFFPSRRVRRKRESRVPIPKPPQILSPPARPDDACVPALTPAPEATPQVPAPGQAEIRGKCYVVDGDTITIAGKNIRLFGIDAPEMDHPYGKPAKWALYRLTRDSEVRAVVQADDHHGRIVATCFLPDGRDLSAEMVRAGMAIDWKKYSGGAYRHLEPADARRKLWRADARQNGRMPPPARSDPSG